MTAVKTLIVFGFAAVLAVVVGLLLFDVPLEYGLDCNRFSGVCTFTQRLLTRSRVGQAKIQELHRAEVRVGRTRRGKPRIMVWVTATGADRFFADYPSRAEAEAGARRINVFLGDPTDGHLFLARSVRRVYWLAWALIPLVAAVIVAVAAILFSKRRSGHPRSATTA